MKGHHIVNIVILNASPKGKNSITLQTVLYLQKRFPEHEYNVLHVGQKIKMYEKDFSVQKEVLEKAQLTLFTYPVYTFIAPYQLHKWLELLRVNDIDLTGKIASQITTSKHFYDVTAHKYIKENCIDLGMKYHDGLSADMEDLLSEKGRMQAEKYWQNLMFCIENNIFAPATPTQKNISTKVYTPCLQPVTKDNSTNVVVVTNCDKQDENLANMITDFTACLPYKTNVINIKDFEFSGGCLGCFECATDGKCIYKDGFDSFLRNEIQTADAIVYAFTIENHFTDSSFKCYDDRQFCNGHRAVTFGIPVGYIICGDYKHESNLQMIVEARCEVGGNYLSYVATDENDTKTEILNLVKSLGFAFENKISRPANFYGVGGTKIFRDLIYITRGLMKADHKFYKKHKNYDFPQKQKATILKMQLVGSLMAIPSVKKKMRGKLNGYIVTPYEKVISQADKK